MKRGPARDMNYYVVFARAESTVDIWGAVALDRVKIH